MSVKSLVQSTLAVTMFSVTISTVLGCTPTPGTGVRAPGTYVTYGRKEPEDIPEISITEVRLEERTLSKRSLPIVPTEFDAETFFLRLDANDDGEVDAAEWFGAPYDTRMEDFANLVGDIDLDGNDSVSMEEFKDVKVVVHRAEGKPAPTTPTW